MKLILIISLLLVNIVANSQNSNFEKGYKEGFAKAYCYGQQIGCIAKAPAIVPMPKINERTTNYQDGYNRGFSEGLDYKRAESNSTIENQKQEIKFNEYISQISSNNIGILAYKEKLYSERKEWIEKTIDNAHNLLTTKFVNLDAAEAKKWYDSMLDFQNKLGSKWPDLSESNVFDPIKSYLISYTASLAQAYSNIKNETDINTINYDGSKYENLPEISFAVIDFYPDVYGKQLCKIVEYTGIKTIEKSIEADNTHILSLRNSKSGSLYINYFKKYDSYYYYFGDNIIKRERKTTEGSENFVIASEYREGGHGNAIFIKLSDFESDYIILDKGKQVSANFLGVVRCRINRYEGAKYIKSFYGRAHCWQDKISGKKYYLDANTIDGMKNFEDALLLTNNMQ